MSQQITTAKTKSFEDNIRLLAQQEDQRLPSASGEQITVKGEEHFFDFVGAKTMQELTTRHGDTQRQDTPHNRRRVTSRTFTAADLIATPDRLEMMANPESSYVRVSAAALNREKDKTWIDAYYGNAGTGKDGTTNVAFPAANEVAVDFATTTTFTIPKLLEAKRLLTAGEAIDGRLFCAITSRQERDLLNINEYISVDFNNEKPLTTGIVGRLAGFTFIRTEVLPLASGTNDRRCPVWSEFGMAFATWEDVFLRIAELPTKNHETQVYVRGKFGAVRLEEARCMSILCDET